MAFYDQEAIVTLVQFLVFRDRYLDRLLAFGVGALADKFEWSLGDFFLAPKIFFECRSKSPVSITNNLFVLYQLFSIHI